MFNSEIDESSSDSTKTDSKGSLNLLEICSEQKKCNEKGRVAGGKDLSPAPSIESKSSSLLPSLSLAETTLEGPLDQASGKSDAETLEEIEKHVQELIAKNQPDHAERFAEYSSRFKSRATVQGISADEQLKTYSLLEKLMQGSDGASPLLDDSSRSLLAVEFMYHAADPSTVDQGDWNTCSVATIEGQMYSKHPSMIADLVQQIALTGEFRALDGKVINVGDQSVLSLWDIKQHPPINGDRTLVSQLFQVTALNDIGQRGELGGFTGKSVHYIEAGDGSMVVLEDGSTDEFRGNNAQTIQNELSRLSGEPSPLVLINVNKDHGKNKGVIHFDTEEQFKTELQKLKDNKNLPVILSLYGNLPPFSDPESKGHVVSVSDIRQNAIGTFDIYVDNQWGKGDTGSDGWYPLTQIYNATFLPESAKTA